MSSSSSSSLHWYSLNKPQEIASPALLIYPNRIEENILKMIAMANGTSSLRPHIKTHKTAEIVQLQQQHGIQKFKCATIAEAELLGKCEAENVLLAMQPVGKHIERFITLIKSFPKTQFSTIVDNKTTLLKISDIANKNDIVVQLYLDINCGMNRTGCVANDQAASLYQAMDENPHVSAMGFHVYDGHIRDIDIAKRTSDCHEAFQPVLDLKSTLKSLGIKVPNIVAGGSASFPIHMKRNDVEASPGTTLLWDARNAGEFPDLTFRIAAVLLIRIISKPAKDILCFDLGHKSVAPEMGFPRVSILGLEESTQISQSEEHLVVQSSRADQFEVGDFFYAVPDHICPTVAKFDKLLTVLDGEVTGEWNVAARGQKITI